MRSHRILLVEDTLALREDLAEVFAAAGHEVACASNGAEAVALAAHGFDLALLDVRLPDGRGTDLLPRLKEMAPESELIVTTGNADLDSALQAVRSGAFAYLIKPVSLEELRITVERALDRVQLREQARALQEALGASERRHRDIVETVPAVIVALDRGLCLRLANHALEQLSGWPRDEVLGREYFEIFAPVAQGPAQRAQARQAFLSSDGDHEVDLVCRDGSTRRVLMRWTKQAQGGEDLIYGMGLDVSVQRDAERKARVAEKLAAVGTLTAGLAHEIRNPLNAAVLQLSLLERRVGRLDGRDKQPLLEPLSLVRAELSRLDVLLGEFLQVARPQEFSHFNVNLCTLVQEVAALQREVAEVHGHSMELRLEECIVVKGDSEALRRMLVNLVKNGLEAASSHVEVAVFREADRAVVTVRDDGPGISPDVQAHMFEPFFTTKDAGTGLGLVMVHTVVTGHAGEVSLQNAEGGGTVARVSLPIER